LNKYGINLNLAPVVDLEINKDSPAIGRYKRSFSSSPEIVTAQGRIFCQAMNKYKIYNCLKHFPGHGSAGTDTHFAKTDISRSWDDLELEPYKRLIPENIADMVMISHIHNKHLDENNPASLSKNIITDLLREKLNWQGVVITDDLQMKAVSNEYSPAEILRLAILAGNDLLLFGNSKPDNQFTIEQIVLTIKEMVYSGEIPRIDIEHSYQRIRQLKAKFIDI
ncbi:MAG: glycoside hydrolase family 3 N-terminal domain-containing protein, partial [Candidatus Stygibacter frigidus]|nr:glycoside hydrolase family 3 N-terminal domain-containing protein [Candidatus Stygibacter frigidus]